MNGPDESNDDAQKDSPSHVSSAPPPPEPEWRTMMQDLGQELADLLEKKTGHPVQIHTMPMFAETEKASTKNDLAARQAQNTILTFTYTPQEIKEHLDQFVIGQDAAKKALAIAICDNYVHLQAFLKDASLKKEHYQKQNVLLLGPSGVGKTYLIKTLAQLIGVPLVIADANRFTEAGFVGANVEDLVRDLVQMAKGNEELAQYGIIYLDEIDKIAGPRDASEISRRGVQNALLKLMEDEEIDLLGGHDVLSQMQELMEFQKSGKVERKIISTKYILFIVSGAFAGLEDIIKRRCHLSTINLVQPSVPTISAAPPSSTPTSAAPSPAPSYAPSSLSSLLSQVTAQDLVNYGLSPEFVGRLPIRVSCQELGAADYAKILRHSRGSILEQYRTSFAHYHIEIHFAEAAIDLMAQWAAAEKTGARALVTIGDRILREFKFILPSFPINYFVVTPTLMKQPQRYLDFLQQNPRAFDRVNFQEIVGATTIKFIQQHPMQIHFAPEAISFLYQYRRARPPLAVLIPKLLTVWQAEQLSGQAITAAWLKNSWELWHGPCTNLSHPLYASPLSRSLP